MSNTPRIGAPLLVSGQATPETTVNDQATLFDAFAGPHFKDRDLTAPPGSPAQGDCYLVAASPTGAWAGQAGNVAIYVNTAWTFITPKEGFLFWVDDENVLVLYDGAAWNVVGVSTGAFLQVANNLSDVSSAGTSRTNLGATTAGGNLFTLANPSAIRFLRINADNTVSALDAATFRTAIGAGTGSGSGDLLSTNNLSDVASATTARANLAAAAHDPSVQAVTSSATVTPAFGDDLVKITAQAAALTLANWSGTAIPGWGIAIRIKDNGTARAISYGTKYRAIGVTLPTTTVISKTLYLGCIYNSDDDKIDVVAVAQEA